MEILSYKFLLGIFLVGFLYCLKYVKREDCQKHFKSIGRGVRSMFEGNAYSNKAWLYLLEPMFIRQLLLVTTCLNSFLEGVVNDSDLKKRIETMNDQLMKYLIRMNPIQKVQFQV